MRDLSIRLFAPLLAGASLRDRLVACLGAFIGIALAGFTYSEIGPAAVPGLTVATLAAPIGASAVLLFAVPSSPLAQPWPVIGGNTISALVGIAVARLIPDPMIAAGVAAGLAIGATMTGALTRPGVAGVQAIGIAVSATARGLTMRALDRSIHQPRPKSNPSLWTFWSP